MDLLRDAGVPGDDDRALSKTLNLCLRSQAHWRACGNSLALAASLTVEGNVHRIMADRAAKLAKQQPHEYGTWSKEWQDRCRLALRCYEDAIYLVTARCQHYAWREVCYCLASALRWKLRLEYAYVGKERQTLEDALAHMQDVSAASQSLVSLLEASRESGAFYTPAPPIYEGNDALAEEGFVDAEAYLQRIPEIIHTSSLYSSLRGAEIPFFKTIGMRGEAIRLLLDGGRSYGALAQVHTLSRNFYRFLELCDELEEPAPDWVRTYEHGPKTPVVSTGALPHDLMHELWRNMSFGKEGFTEHADFII